VKTRLAETCVFVATGPSGDIIGTVGYHVVGSEEAHIRGMAVLPAWQGRAVAQGMLDAVLTDARRRGCSKATLDTTAPLERAVRFYERNGFRASGRVADFFGMPLFEYVRPLS
jgi:ribosomal protein S18 acetylase RimI-like enzyme